MPLAKPRLNQQATKEGIEQEVTRVASRVKPGGRLWIIYTASVSHQRGGAPVGGRLDRSQRLPHAAGAGRDLHARLPAGPDRL